MADQKITALTAITSLTDDDLVPVVNDPGTTPVTNKITWANIKATILSVFSTNGISLPSSAGTAVFTADISAGSTFSMAASDPTLGYPFGAANNFSGLLIINDTTVDGTTAIFLCGGGTTYLVGGSSTIYSITVDTASKVNVYYNGSTHLTFQNKTGAARVFRVTSIRTRSTG